MVKLTAYNSAMFIATGDGDNRVVLDEEVAWLVVGEVGLAECKHGSCVCKMMMKFH